MILSQTSTSMFCQPPLPTVPTSHSCSFKAARAWQSEVSGVWTYCNPQKRIWRCPRKRMPSIFKSFIYYFEIWNLKLNHQEWKDSWGKENVDLFQNHHVLSFLCRQHVLPVKQLMFYASAGPQHEPRLNAVAPPIWISWKATWSVSPSPKCSMYEIFA